MPEVFLVDGVRTAQGRYGGVLAGVRPDDLAATVVAEVVRRAGVPVDALDEVVLGAANQAGEDNRNVARMAALLAGLPDEVPGYTVNRLCASGLTAVASAAATIRSGEADVIVAGGVESMTRAPWVMQKPGDRVGASRRGLRHLARLALHQPHVRRLRQERARGRRPGDPQDHAVDGGDRRGGRRARRHRPHRVRRVRAGEPPEGDRGDRRRAVRARDRSGHGAKPQGRDRGLGGRGPAPRELARSRWASCARCSARTAS